MQDFADVHRHQRHGAILKNVDDFDGLERQLKLRFTTLQKLGAPGGVAAAAELNSSYFQLEGNTKDAHLTVISFSGLGRWHCRSRRRWFRSFCAGFWKGGCGANSLRGRSSFRLASRCLKKGGLAWHKILRDVWTRLRTAWLHHFFREESGGFAAADKQARPGEMIKDFINVAKLLF